VTATKSRHFSPFSLDAINFLLADVRGALGPYLNVFLVTQQHWSLSEVGLVTTIGGLPSATTCEAGGKVTKAGLVNCIIDSRPLHGAGKGFKLRDVVGLPGLDKLP
jgi:hypothetical protein